MLEQDPMLWLSILIFWSRTLNLSWMVKITYMLE